MAMVMVMVMGVVMVFYLFVHVGQEGCGIIGYYSTHCIDLIIFETICDPLNEIFDSFRRIIDSMHLCSSRENQVE